MRRATDDPGVRVIILTGAGRGFCAGADMGGLQAIGAGAATDRSSKALEGLPGGSTLAEFKMNYSYFPSIPKFIIAAINGPCAGLGPRSLSSISPSSCNCCRSAQSSAKYARKSMP